MVIGGLFDGYDVGIGMSQPLSFRGGAHALEMIFEKLGTASPRSVVIHRNVDGGFLGSELAFANTDLSRAWSTTWKSGCGQVRVTLLRAFPDIFTDYPWYVLSI